MSDDIETLRATLRLTEAEKEHQREQANASDAENVKLRKVIKWALGEFDDFPDWPPSLYMQGEPKYWWRKELRQRYIDATTEESEENKIDTLLTKLQTAINEYRRTK